MEEIKPDKTLDLTGLSCPLPVVMTSEAMRKLRDGQVLKVVATDPGFEKDIWDWAKKSGNELIKLERDGEKTVVYLRKLPQAKEPSLAYWVKFHALGVKLHLRKLLVELNPFRRKPDHFITFTALSEGLQAEKKLGDGDAFLLPIPDEIDPRCGVVLAVRGFERAKEIYERLKDEGVAVEAVYRKRGKTYERVLP
ncbi:MAG: DUF3343 domain-containing protein [Aquificae bacterium]|nr:DUF3343 domain-containing protein [Aquificota bacterium]